MLDTVGGIDLSTLGSHAPEVVFPATVPGRVVNFDADFLAYQVSADDTKSLEDMQHNAREAIEFIRKMAGGESVSLHVTPKDSDKGRRYALAIQKEYQGNRADKPKPEHLEGIREWMISELGAHGWRNCEADDGMAMHQHAAIARGDRGLSVIASRDKDLRMVEGLHLDMDSMEIVDASGFGHIEIAETPGGTKKVVGLGSKFFWAQVLMGDTADNIGGLPTVHRSVLNKVDPTKATSAAQDIVEGRVPATTAKLEKAQSTLDTRKSKQCGQMMAMKILRNVTSDKQAFNVVKYLFQKAGEETHFTHWQTGMDAHWNDVLASEMQLIWMRRKNDPNDVFEWLKEVAL